MSDLSKGEKIKNRVSIDLILTIPLQYPFVTTFLVVTFLLKTRAKKRLIHVKTQTNP